MEKVLDHGFVRLVDYMPQKDLDSSIVQAARVSYGDGTKSTRGDRGLIRYLLRHWHTTPFEMVEFKFHIRCPSTSQTHMRHRQPQLMSYPPVTPSFPRSIMNQTL